MRKLEQETLQVIVIDHYDSFTHNVLEWLRGGSLGLDVRLVEAGDTEALRELSKDPVPLVLGPGPKSPEDVPETILLTQKSLGIVPVLGICLGHQILGGLGGGRVIRSQSPHHGSTRQIRRVGHEGILAGLPGSFRGATYNSLVVDPQGLSKGWRVAARCEFGEVQALVYDEPGRAPALGLQFHPESFMTEQESGLREIWVRILKDWAEGNGPWICRSPQASAIAPLSMPS